MLFMGCTSQKQADPRVDAFAHAKWIGFEALPDSLKCIPAVHGNGDHLGNRCMQRSVVPVFRRDFREMKEINSATINICGLGQYELYLNGHKVGDRFLAPGWSLYQKRCLYNTYDITDQIKQGENTLAAMVGNGFFNVNRERYRKLVVAYGYPRLIFNLTLQYKDGSSRQIISDENCRVHPSPITFSSIYGGEDYDARMEQEGWSVPGFDDTGWQNAILLKEPIGELVPENDFPLKILQEFEVKKISRSRTGRIIYDFGQNTSGIISLKVRGERGTLIKIIPGELLDDQGNISQVSGGGPYEFNYILKGDGEEEWHPRFTYYGFRYAAVEIIEPDEAEIKTEILDMALLHIRNASPAAGSFSCSDSLFNKIFELINWSIRSNMASVATDCPHREKLGWLEVPYLMGSSIHYNYDIQAWYNKIVDDMIDSQLDNGLVPDIAPEYVPFEGGFRDSPEWGSASVIIPWLLYKWYGDADVLERAYPMMQRYVGYLQTLAKDHILDHGLGDWYDLGPDPPGRAQLTPRALTATSIYFYDLQVVANVADILGRRKDAEKYRDLSSNIKEAFQNRFYDPVSGVCSTGSQTAYAMSLYTGLIPERDRNRVFNNLVDSIIEHDYALTSGDIGYHFLVRVLTEHGRSDILYRMNSRTDIPGYGYQLSKGATSLTESWAALPNNSNNHMMLGHLMEWFYNGLGGIYQTGESVAYNEIIIAPNPVGGMRWVKCSYRSIKGIISSDWEIKGDTFILKTELPGNVYARISMPGKYMNTSCVITDLKKGSSFHAVPAGGEFELGPGKYKIVSN
jgi:alpha-L-rhamnosidase